ncbi:MAG: hypothetical protein COB49_03080 [Alphaproteobacteria bacterium]|nr:MAG: hypothetical protein COB49_03080 [Alphaproteobacteria bacterium]
MLLIDQLELTPSQTIILREVHRATTASRVDLSRITGLSTQSLTRITKQLIDMGILVEGERRINGRGQPAIHLSISPSRFVSFGIVIEHDQITCVAVEMCGEQILYLKRRGNYMCAKDALSEAQFMLSTAVSQAPKNSYALGVGISVSGFFYKEASRKFISYNDPNGWRKIDLTKDLKMPINMPIIVENDGRSAAIGQAIDGVGRNLDSFFLILMTQDVGGGFVHKGDLIRGQLGNAGEVGEFVPRGPSAIRPTTESLEKFLKNKFGTMLSDLEIEKALLHKDKIIYEWVEGAAESLKPALSAITKLLDPYAIILAGRLLPSLREAVASKIKIDGLSFQGLSAPTPRIIVDPRTDNPCLGASALPVALFLYN